MKIQNINNYVSYKGSSKTVKNEGLVKARKYDVIDIKSRVAGENVSTDVVSVKKDIVSKVNKETNADKLSRIKNSVDDKTYDIDVEEVVRRLLR